ncbi:MAG: hypothetical protein COA75_14335 [Cellvibrionales bacterium]|nr:MAG: hypothetical protein COA75_14335 [Cellvibrionales bacterium]
MIYNKFCSIITVFVAAFFLSSCSITTAPTEASSATTGQTTDASSELTSSTSSQDDDDGVDTEAVEVEEFVSLNFSQLRSDMSVGEGEYLTSLASLLAIDDADKGRFYAMTKSNFNQLFISSQTTPKELIVHLKQEVALARI